MRLMINIPAPQRFIIPIQKQPFKRQCFHMPIGEHHIPSLRVPRHRVSGSIDHCNTTKNNRFIPGPIKKRLNRCILGKITASFRQKCKIVSQLNQWQALPNALGHKYHGKRFTFAFHFRFFPFNRRECAGAKSP